MLALFFFISLPVVESLVVADIHIAVCHQVPWSPEEGDKYLHFLILWLMILNCIFNLEIWNTNFDTKVWFQQSNDSFYIEYISIIHQNDKSEQCSVHCFLSAFLSSFDFQASWFATQLCSGHTVLSLPVKEVNLTRSSPITDLHLTLPI